MGSKNHTLFYIFLLSYPIICWSAASVAPDDLHEDKVKHFEKDGAHNVEYDHEAFLGEEAKSFDSLSPEESRKRLGLIVDKIDKDQDGFVTTEELKDWIKYTQEKFIRDNVDRMWNNHNPQGAEKLGWDEYSESVYGFMKDMTDEELNKKDNQLTYQGLYNRDKRRWTASDLDGDGLLTKHEFFSFLHPEESPHMRSIIIQETVEDLDSDKDGKISLDEYIGDLYQGEDDFKPQWVETEIENFKKVRDADGDGYITGDEVKSIIGPEDYDYAKAEAQHLIYEADRNDDKKLTKEEIIEKYDLFVGSQATDFGEALVRHDEF
ncbi:calumenin-B [Cimex lectularius]|uniref:Reticulocalbin-3 n=1 Tax=Cimex lectularius TaxID=79782 RepID=A0A8I6S8J7_CIMLE|nr:calumenin-B [Cimex lectularius]XP_014259849.1 calumenin-B [Cimex lectularius]XP_014259854.1 calumenin-B [Cimex lectularius]XP_024086404.1 calumenin-B [Cimex lectularius]